MGGGDTMSGRKSHRKLDRHMDRHTFSHTHTQANTHIQLHTYTHEDNTHIYLNLNTDFSKGSTDSPSQARPSC